MFVGGRRSPIKKGGGAGAAKGVRAMRGLITLRRLVVARPLYYIGSTRGATLEGSSERAVRTRLRKHHRADDTIR
jgi:hypothetical protein